MDQAQGRPVRIQKQIDAAGKPVFLVAPSETDTGQELSRVNACNVSGSAPTLERLRADRIPMLAAIAEAPPGWYRDGRGRVFQIEFDMFKRFHVGGGWLPTWDSSSGSHDYRRARLEMGFIGSWVVPESRMRHTVRAIEGSIVLDDLNARGQLFAYELDHLSTEPLVRVTTFFGKPHRCDAHMDVGFGIRAGGLHPLRSRFANTTHGFGIGPRYDIDLIGIGLSQRPRTVHRVAPFTSPSVRLRWHDRPGLTLAEISGAWLPHWASEGGVDEPCR